MIVLGASYAGVQAAISAREAGYAEQIALISDETRVAYQRPLLSKDFLTKDMAEDELVIRDDAFFRSNGIDLITGTRAVAIDRSAQKIELADGSHLKFDQLIIATGSRARRCRIPGADLDGVCYLRSIGDANELKERLAAANDIVVLGGGFVGLEVASSATILGRRVSLVETTDRLLKRAVSPVISEYLRNLHRLNGVEISFNENVVSIEGSEGRVTAVVTTGERRLPADLVIIGIGGLPNDDLAAAAGLTCANGILVDQNGRTSDPNILAAGDCANIYNLFADDQVRLESVQSALDLGSLAGHTAAGKPSPVTGAPRFWSTQYDAALQMSGLLRNFDDVAVRGSVEDKNFSVFCYLGDRLVAAESVNRPGEQMIARRMIEAGISPSRDEAKDMSVDLKALWKSRRNG